MKALVVSVRINEANPNHHLYNNNGTYWLHYTLHRPDFTKSRIRSSLATKNLRDARQKRDHILAARLREV